MKIIKFIRSNIEIIKNNYKILRLGRYYVEVLVLDNERIYKKIDDALEIASRYSQIDGSHHKAWAIDQMVRALLGENDNYEKWVKEKCDGEDGPNTYSWDVGIPP